ALSTSMEAQIKRQGHVWKQTFKQGVPDGPIKKVEPTDKTGTSITFYPDPSIFKETTKFEFDWVVDYLRHQAYLTKGVKTTVVDERSGQRCSFYFEGGIQSYVRHLNIGKETVGDKIFYVEKLAGDVMVEVALQYNDTFNEVVKAF